MFLSDYRCEMTDATLSTENRVSGKDLRRQRIKANHWRLRAGFEAMRDAGQLPPNMDYTHWLHSQERRDARVVPSVRIDPVEAIVSDALTPTDDLHEPVCPPESRCVICWDDDDSVIKALVADRDRLRVVFDEACWEIKTSHGKPCFCKYCTVSEADKAEGRKMEARLIDREQEVGDRLPSGSTGAKSDCATANRAAPVGVTSASHCCEHGHGEHRVGSVSEAAELRVMTPIGPVPAVPIGDSPKCRVCGDPVTIVKAGETDGFCEKHCPDHIYEYVRGEGHRCTTCHAQPPEDYFDE